MAKLRLLASCDVVEEEFLLLRFLGLNRRPSDTPHRHASVINNPPLRTSTTSYQNGQFQPMEHSIVLQSESIPSFISFFCLYFSEYSSEEGNLLAVQVS